MRAGDRQDSLLEFADLLDGVDEALRPTTIDVGVELPTVDRFAALARRLGCGESRSSRSRRG